MGNSTRKGKRGVIKVNGRYIFLVFALGAKREKKNCLRWPMKHSGDLRYTVEKLRSLATSNKGVFEELKKFQGS